MNLDDYHITDITQCSVGDTMLVYTHSYSRIFMSKATITRLMKTRFDLEFEDGRCGTYRTRNTWCVLESFGAHRYPFTGAKMLYTTSEVMRWSEAMTMRTEADSLRRSLHNFLEENFNNSDKMLEISTETVRRAEQILDLETRASDILDALDDAED